MCTTRNPFRFLCLLLLCLLFSTATAVAQSGSVIYHEPFNDDTNLVTNLFETSTSRRYDRFGFDRYLTFSFSDDIGPGRYARLPGNRRPEIFTGNDSTYFATRTMHRIGRIYTRNFITVENYSDLKLVLRYAASQDVNNFRDYDFQNSFARREYLRILVQYRTSNGRTHVRYLDYMEGGNPLRVDKPLSRNSALASRSTQKTSNTNFVEEEWNLADAFRNDADDVTSLRVILYTSSSSEYVGFDDLKITGTLPGNDQCPDDPNKTEPGVCGCGTADTDSDSDGTPDCADQCVDDATKTEPGTCGCGVSDSDSDNDGTPDCNDQCVDDAAKTAPGQCGCGVADTDSDNDGVADCNDSCEESDIKTEPGQCGCDVPDTDSDNDGTADCNDQCVDDAAKTAPGQCGCGVADTDSDNDGVADCNDQCVDDANKTEAGQCGCGVADTDSDNDGTADCNDQCVDDAAKTAPGQCGCGVADTDSDNDGVADCNDSCEASDIKTEPGQCGCNVADTDSDNDGVADCNDQCVDDANKTEAGQCGCGVADTDSDNDGTADCNDQCVDDAAKTAPGQCGCGLADTDSDNDGVADCNDQCVDDANKTEAGQCGCGVADTDSDNDGTADCNDQCVDDATKTAPGQCGCGVADTDSDNDGVADCNDQCVDDANKTEAGQCGCGVADTDSDNDGTADCNDQCVDDAAKTAPGQCGCGVADTDSDNDGVADCNDQCVDDANKTEAGQCGCGVADTDSDNDGTADCNDQCVDDAAKTAPGQCGCGVADTDSDSDGTADCNDQCVSDANKTEPGSCGCGTPDDDTDTDGTPDCNDECPLDATKTAAGVCGCGIPDDTPLCLLNGDFQTGDLTNWTVNTASGGAIDVMEEGPQGNFASRMTAGSPVSQTIKVNTPAEFFYLLFDTKFASTAGDLTVTLAGVEQIVIGAPTSADTDFTTHTVIVTAETLQSLTLAPIQFTFDAPTNLQLYIDNVVIVPGSAGESCIYGGDAIGADSSATDGHGAVDSTQSGDLLNWNWNVNVGAPAFEFNSDGKAQFDKLRAVTTIARNLTDSPLDWSRHNWTVDVWEKSSYLAKGAPIVTANLGATPSNWSGYQTLANGDRVPDIAPFGVPGGNAPDGTVSYEMVFDLSGVSSFQTPLPEGDYIVSFTSRTAINTHGGSGVLSSRIGQGPVPFYSATSPFRFEPGPVIGRITSNEDFRFALNLTVKRLNCGL